MRNWPFVMAWALILGVGACDTYFAWYYRAVFEAWEMNPLARLVASHLGLGAVFGLKAAVMAFAVAVAAACHRCRRRATGILYTACLGGVHLLLGLHYLIGILQR